jgi:hypothetical protein
MRQLMIIRDDETISADDRARLNVAANIEGAWKLAPWAAEIVEVEGGWQAFESGTDNDTWAAQI